MEEKNQNLSDAAQGADARTVQPAIPGMEGIAPERLPARPGLRYSTSRLILELKRTRNNLSEAARRLGCSRTTLQNRVKESELAEIAKEIDMQMLDSAHSIIKRAANDDCLECAGLGQIPVEPAMVGDPEWGECLVCFGTGCCRQKLHKGLDGNVRVVAWREEISPMERRQWALKVVERYGAEASKTIPVPPNWADALTIDQMMWAQGQLKNKVPFAEVYRIIATKAIPVEATAGEPVEPRQLNPAAAPAVEPAE